MTLMIPDHFLICKVGDNTRLSVCILVYYGSLLVLFVYLFNRWDKGDWTDDTDQVIIKGVLYSR